jgi:ribosomal protein L9
MEVAKQSLVQQWNVIADAIRGKVITISQKASPKGQLYAAVTAEILLPELTSIAGADIAVDAIRIKTPIKSLGTHDIEVYFSPDLIITMQVIISQIEEQVEVVETPKKKRSASKK